MDKTPPRGLDGKFVTLIHVILFLFPALWFGSRHLFPTWSLFLVLVAVGLPLGTGGPSGLALISTFCPE